MLPILLGAAALVFLWAFINALRTGEAEQYSSINPTRRDQPVMFWFLTIMWGVFCGLSTLAAIGAFVDGT